MNSYILDCSHCSKSLACIEFTILVLVEVLGDHVVSIADKTITIKVI